MIYILRHGKTEWNKRKKLQGRTDIPLCEEGRVMAQEAAEKYAGVHFDVCYCSPLIRAKETAEIILKDRNVPMSSDLINVLFKDPANYKAPADAGESLDELFARTKSFMDEVIEPLRKEGKDVLIVGHGALNSCMLTQAKGLPRKDFWSHGIVQCTLMTLFDDTKD